jgi:hypothetical protein
MVRLFEGFDDRSSPNALPGQFSVASATKGVFQGILHLFDARDFSAFVG